MNRDAIDLFAGWGGFTEGAEKAGARVVWAANHWRLAVDAHALNHPKTAHVCQDLRQADWSRLPPYGLLLAAPACQGHSNASQPGRRGYHDALRATAWAVVDCAEVSAPEALIVENVLQFRRWKLYPRWRQCLEDLGFELTENVVTASWHGVPQRRTRLFIVGTRGKPFTFRQEPKAEPAFGPCVDWDEGDWRPFSAARGEGARERLRQASRRYGRAIVQHVSVSTNAKAATGLSLDEPIRTITTQDQWCVVSGKRYRPLTVRETARAMGFRDGYRWPEHSGRREAIRGLGNAVCPPVATELVGQLLDAM